MKIVSCEVFPLVYRWRETREFIGGTAAVTRAVVVRLKTDEGLTGYGESPDGIWYGGYSQSGIAQTISDHIAPVILGRDPLEREALVAEMDSVVDAAHFAKAAVDFAIHDLAGRILGVPAHVLIGGPCRKTVPLAGVVMWGSPAEAAQQALFFTGLGFKTIKLKSGIDPVTDVERVRAVREAIGPDIPIRVDFNEGYVPTTAIQVIRKMEPYGIQFAEQPTLRTDLEGMARVALAVDTPISADDALYGPKQAIELIRHRAASVFNIYPLQAGGLIGAKRIQAIAQAAGIKCFVGSMPGSSMEDVASLQFLASVPDLDYACECLASFVHDRDPLKVRPSVVDGEAVIPEGPGFGWEIDETALTDLAGSGTAMINRFKIGRAR